MKTRLIITLAALPALAVLSPRPAVAVDMGISAGVQINAPGVGIQIGSRNDFYTPLQPYGTWVNFQNYGRCFHPTGVAADWRPYSNGSWENTDAGWYWNSDEPFAWACYHYGSWYYDTSYGWVWIPGTDWAPAWVNWRDSDGYIGWAPCGPNRAVLDASFFVFCDVHHFGDRFSPRGLIINNRDIINRTRVVNDFSRRSVDFNGRRETIFANRGPSIDVVRRATGAHFDAHPRPVADVWRENRDRRPDNMRGNENRPEDRNARPEDRNARPEDRNVRPEDQRRDTPPPTGADQQRRYEQQQQQDRLQQQQRQQEQNRNNLRPEDQQRQNNPPPTGTEQQRRYEQQQQQQQRQVAPRNDQPEKKAPETPQARPEQRPNVTPPATGRDQERIYHEPNAQAPDHGNNATPPKAEQRSTPASEQRQAVPQERTLPPTGRESAPAQRPPEAARPEQAPQHAPADSQEKDKDKDKQQP